MVVVTFIFAVGLAFAAAFFALQNPTLVAANFFGVTVEGSLAVFVLLGLGVGFLIGVLVMLPGRIKSGISNSRNRRRIAELETSSGSRQAAPAPKKPSQSTPE